MKKSIAIIFGALAIAATISLPAGRVAASTPWSDHTRAMNAKIERGYFVCDGKKMPVGETRSHMAQMRADWLKANPGQGTANFDIDCK